MKRFLLLLMAFAVLVVVLAAGLRQDPRRLPSALIGQPAPFFDLPTLQAAGERVSPRALRSAASLAPQSVVTRPIWQSSRGHRRPRRAQLGSENGYAC